MGHVESIAGTRSQRHKEWHRRPFDPQYLGLYGTQKLANMKLAGTTTVLDNNIRKLYYKPVALRWARRGLWAPMR